MVSFVMIVFRDPTNRPVQGTLAKEHHSIQASFPNGTNETLCKIVEIRRSW